MKKKPPDYRSILKTEFARAKIRSPGMSLTDFAKLIGLSKSHLSQVLSRKYDLSERMAVKVAEKLKMSEAEKQIFFASVGSSGSKKKDKSIRSRMAGKLKKVAQGKVNYLPDNSSFEIVADAALEVIRVLKPASKAEAIQRAAQALGFQEGDVKRSIDWLFAKGILEESNGAVVAKEVTDISWDNVQQNHMTALKLGANNLGTDRHWAISCGIISVDRSRKDEAVSMLREFAARFLETFGDFQNTNDVILFNLHISSLLRKPKS